MEIWGQKKKLPPIANLKTEPNNVTGTIRMKSGDKTVSLYLYGPVSEWMGEDGICAKDVINAVDAIPPGTEQVFLHINSPGGSVFEAKAICANIQRIRCQTIAIVDGLCASAAVSIALACGKVQMTKGSYMMIHQASSVVFGNKQDMRKMAEILETIEQSVVDSYVEKTGLPPEEVIAMMEATTWFEADEAKKKGFADEVIDEPRKLQEEPENKAEESKEPDSQGRYMTNANRLRLLELM